MHVMVQGTGMDPFCRMAQGRTYFVL